MSDGTLTIRINDADRRFRFEEVGNTSPAALVFDAGLRAITVLKDGVWDLVFKANGFSFNAQPVSWPKGQPENVELTIHDADSFTLQNTVSAKQPLIDFLIHSDIFKEPLDPTIFNNPQPDFAAAGEPRTAAPATVAC